MPGLTAPVTAVYLTFPNPEVASQVAHALVQRGLAACVNLLPSGTSVYRWQGEVVTEPEVVAFAKTTPARLPELVAAVQELHPYEVPAVVAYEAVGGLAAYLGWVADSTGR